MKHTIAAALLAAGVVALRLSAAQGPPDQVTVSAGEYDMGRLLAPAPQPEAVLKGRVLWVQRCAFCHDGLGTPTYRTLGPWLDADTIRSMGDARLREKIAMGSARMPGFQYSLQPEQVDRLVAFLKRVNRRSLSRVIQHPYLVLAGCGVLLVGALALLPLMGRNFLPEFNEGTATIGVAAAPWAATERSKPCALRDSLKRAPPG